MKYIFIINLTYFILIFLCSGFEILFSFVKVFLKIEVRRYGVGNGVNFQLFVYFRYLLYLVFSNWDLFFLCFEKIVVFIDCISLLFIIILSEKFIIRRINKEENVVLNVKYLLLIVWEICYGFLIFGLLRKILNFYIYVYRGIQVF